MRNNLYKLLCLFFLLAAPYCGSAQQIPWRSDYLLSWADFAGPIPANTIYAAETRWEYKYRTSWDKNGKISVKVECFFDKQKSWKNPQKNLTTKLLLHEQLHFYAAEVYARKMRQAFGEYAATHEHSASTDADLSRIYRDLKAEGDRYQEQYDTDTDHSKIDAKQEEWRKKIVAELNTLSAFEVK